MVLILTFSFTIVRTVITTQESIRNNVAAGQYDATRNAAEQRANRYAQEGYNPYTQETNGEDYTMTVTVAGQEYQQEVWASTGCPVPNQAPAGGENIDFGPSANPADITYNVYALDGTATPTTLKQKCFPNDQPVFQQPGGIFGGGRIANNPNYYFVYPTPLLNHGRTQVTVASSTTCEPNTIYSQYDGTPINPLDHPCYWGKIEPGTSVRIPLNKFDRDISQIFNPDGNTLKLRIRTQCANGNEWCPDSERVTFDVDLPSASVPLIDVDSSNLAMDWVLEIGSGQKNYGSSDGSPRVEDIQFCSTFGIDDCRAAINTQITMHKLQTGKLINNFNQESRSPQFMDILRLGSRFLAPVNDLGTNRIPEGYSSLISLLSSIQSNSIDLQFQLNNNTYDESFEFQLVSSSRHFR